MNNQKQSNNQKKQVKVTSRQSGKIKFVDAPAGKSMPGKTSFSESQQVSELSSASTDTIKGRHVQSSGGNVAKNTNKEKKVRLNPAMNFCERITQARLSHSRKKLFAVLEAKHRSQWSLKKNWLTMP